ncbi:ras and Rab interactor 3 [Pholidichthys leucotaenia]
MEASVVTPDPGPLTGALDSPSSPCPSPLSPSPLPPSSQSPARPCRPKPPPPALKSSQIPTRPPLPPSTPLSLPPPLSPIPTFVPPLLSPPPSDPSPLLSPSPPLSPGVPSPSPPSPPPPALFTPSLPAPPMDRLVGSASVWKPSGLSKDQCTRILEKEPAGAFLVHSTEDKATTVVSVRLPDEDGVPLVQNLTLRQHRTFIHIDASSLVFSDIFKLISFYCVSRDILPIPLRLPQAIATATSREDLEIISAMGADFWTSDLNQQVKKNPSPVPPQDCITPHLYVDPVPMEEGPGEDPTPSSIHKHGVTSGINSSLSNGDISLNIIPQVKGQTKAASSQETKYKRPPPRPPSLGSGSAAGLLFSPPSSIQNLPAEDGKRKDEGKGGVGEKEERKSASTSPPPLRPPIPALGRAAPPLPPAPLCRTSSRKSSERVLGEGTEREMGQNAAKRSEKEEGAERGRMKSSSGLLFEENSEEHREEEEEELSREGEKKVKEEGKDNKQKPTSQGPLLGKKPSRPVPPPRRKLSSPDSPVGPNEARGAAVANQGAGVSAPPPSMVRRPDVSLYSPQGGAVLGTDPDSCSTSSTEEEGELNQEPSQNHSHLPETRSPKAAIRRTPTTMILDRARSRLSTVLTGLISHDRRLTQRIVELARDPQSYFGNLVKEHRAFTMETMASHSTSTEMLQEIRQMMTQLKNYLLQSSELQAMLDPQHQYTQDKLESIAEAALCKSVLKPLKEPIYQSLEKLHTDNNGLKQLAQNQSIVLGSTTTSLGVTTAIPDASAMEKISIKLNKLYQEYSPLKKVELLLKACKIIYDSMSVSCPGRAHGADDFLPVMMYVLARSNLSALQLDVEYMMELMDPSLTLGEGSYYLTTTYGALEHIKTFDQQRTATRQLSREVQDSINRWERRRTLNQEHVTQGSIRDFLTVCCPEIGANPKTLGVLPTTTIQQLAEQCAARFKQDSYILSVYINGVQRPAAPTEPALGIKNSCQPGAYCFIFHPNDSPGSNARPPTRSCPREPPPAPPPPPPSQSLILAETPAVSTVEPAEEQVPQQQQQEEEEEESLISF